MALVNAIEALANPSNAVSHINDQFDLDELLKVCRIDAADSIYINWYRYDKIDKLKKIDLTKYFFDIWYQDVDDVDDVEVFDDSFNWILLICHDGRVKLLRVQSSLSLQRH